MSTMTVCYIDETQQSMNDDLDLTVKPRDGIRTAIISTYDLPKYFYGVDEKGAVKKLSLLGGLIWYAVQVREGKCNKRRFPMDVDAVVTHWSEVVAGLATAHDKDEADRYEHAIDDCLSPILTAPIKQIREFYPKLLAKLKANPAVPFMVWRSYEVWIDQVLDKAPDEEILSLKTSLAQEISALVEQDVKDQIPEQLIRALQWRNAEQLEHVKTEAIKTKERGGKVKLVGRESCLFMQLGPDPDNPAVVIQI